MIEAGPQPSPAPFSTGESHAFVETVPHGEALARVLFLAEQGRRFGLVSGPAGVGKSAVLREAHRQLQRTQRQTVLIDLAELREGGLLPTMLGGLRLGPDSGDSTARHWRRLQDYLCGLECLRRQAVFLFDHFEPNQKENAQIIRRLQHLPGAEQGLTTTIAAVESSWPPPESPPCQGMDRRGVLAGLLELCDLRIEIESLDPPQTVFFVDRLLAQSGRDLDLFEPSALQRVYDLSGGLPGAIQRVCAGALAVTDQRRLPAVSAGVVESVARGARPVPLRETDQPDDHAVIPLLQSAGQPVC